MKDSKDGRKGMQRDGHVKRYEGKRGGRKGGKIRDNKKGGRGIQGKGCNRRKWKKVI